MKIEITNHSVLLHHVTLYYVQNIDFICYHVRRTTVTVFLHLSLPLVYCLGLSVDNHQPSQSSIYTAQVVLNASVAHPAATQYVPSELR